MEQFVTCPRCGEGEPRKVTFTWWGGLLGPSMFHHVKCRSCGTAYNGKTGGSNATVIAVYVAVSVVIGLALGVVAWRMW